MERGPQTTFSVQFCLESPPPSSSSCTGILLFLFLTPDLFSKYSVVVLSSVALLWRVYTIYNCLLETQSNYGPVSQRIHDKRWQRSKNDFSLPVFNAPVEEVTVGILYRPFLQILSPVTFLSLSLSLSLSNGLISPFSSRTCTEVSAWCWKYWSVRQIKPAQLAFGRILI